MRMTLSTKRPCRLGPGELRRVPQDSLRPLVGYYVGCPRCRWVTAALQGDDGLTIDENSGEVTLSSPLVCTGCRVRIHLRAGDAELVEPADVRPILFR